MRGATRPSASLPACVGYFNPRSSCEERRCFLGPTSLGRYYFNPRSSCEERRGLTSCLSRLLNFNPRSSCEERLHKSQQSCKRPNFNPRSSCEERPNANSASLISPFISIHAPHARSDQRPPCWRQGYLHYFNPRSSCEERPHRFCRFCLHILYHFNPRSSCEERLRCRYHAATN